MKNPEEDQLIAYLLNDLPPDTHRQLGKQIEQSSELQQKLEELKMVLNLFDDQAGIEPSQASRDRFYRFLEMEARQANIQTSSSRFSWKVAAAIAVLLIGIGFGVIWQNNRQQQHQIRLLSEEVVETRKLLLLAMLEDASASQRINAINVSIRDFETDQRVIEAMIQRLQKDENENVRLKAAASLGRYIHLDLVMEAAIQALEYESSPEVQIMLIESLVNGGRKEAGPSFRRLMDREDVPAVVQDLAAHGLEQMI